MVGLCFTEAETWAVKESSPRQRILPYCHFLLTSFCKLFPERNNMHTNDFFILTQTVKRKYVDLLASSFAGTQSLWSCSELVFSRSRSFVTPQRFTHSPNKQKLPGLSPGGGKSHCVRYLLWWPCVKKGAAESSFLFSQLGCQLSACVRTSSQITFMQLLNFICSFLSDETVQEMWFGEFT